MRNVFIIPRRAIRIMLRMGSRILERVSKRWIY